MRRLYIGISHTFHDSALAVVDGAGKVLHAQATERSVQSKRSLFMLPINQGTVKQAIAPHLTADTQLVVAFTWSLSHIEEQANAWFLEKDLTKIEPPMPASFFLGAKSMRYLSYLQIRDLLGKMHLLPPDRAPEIRAYDHHLTHAAMACYASPYESAACAVIDGMGDGSSTAFYRYEKGELTRLDAPPLGIFPSGSLGFFYAALCEACNFDAYAGEEWKVMGLSAYGEFDQAAYDAMRPMVTVDDLVIRSTYPPPQEFETWAQLKQRFAQRGNDPRAFANLAFTGQRVFEDASKELLQNLHRRGISQNLVLTGGCALNSLWNGRIVAETGFSSLFVPSAPADDGNAMGAAWLALREDQPDFRPAASVHTPYLGDELDEQTLRYATTLGGLTSTKLDGKPAHRRAAELLAEGKIIGWAQGRAEFGPRALGNRSILADARVANVKALLNAKVKFREEFRPFAPSILHEHGDEYFEDYQESPYMDRTLKLRETVRDKIPGVVHEDATGRLQSVKREWNPRYYDLIKAFHDLTGVPLIVNTSFNVMGKPIIHSVEDAIAVFMTTGLDALVIGDHVFEKR